MDNGGSANQNIINYNILGYIIIIITQWTCVIKILYQARGSSNNNTVIGIILQVHSLFIGENIMEIVVGSVITLLGVHLYDDLTDTLC